VDYCDLCCLGPITEEALGLDEAAKTAGITAVVGAGIVTALTSLLMMHAARRLDQADELRFCVFQVVALYGGDPKSLLAQWRAMGHADASWQVWMRQAAGPVTVYREGRPLGVDPWGAAVHITLPQGRAATAHPLALPEPITLPRALPDVRSVSNLYSMHPPEAMEVFCDFGRRVARGELSESAAAIAFFEYLATLPEQSLAVPADCASDWINWAEAIGTKDGRPTRYRCWPVGDWDTTSGPLATVALKILGGEIATPGVVAPESCLEPLPFFAEVARWVPELPADAPLLAESFQELG
jgi:lysine 6-dehydrogenase